MPALRMAALESLELKDLQDLLGSDGPCVTLLLPAHRPGAQSRPPAAVLKTYLQDVAGELAARRIPASTITDLLAPLEELTHEEEFLAGSHWGRVIFRAPDVLAQFELIEPQVPAFSVGGCFEIRSVLDELHRPPEFYILKLSKKNVALLRCAHLRAEAMTLPKGVPETLEAALEFEQPDHDLMNRSSAGPSVGSMGGVSFGTGSGRERQRAHLADFYKLVDRGLAQLFNGGKAPLVLAGVDEDTAVYRSIATYKNLLGSGIAGSPGEWVSDQELLRQAYGVIQARQIEQAAAEAVDYHERSTPSRFSLDLDAILKAALEGRVHRLYLDKVARKPGVFHGAKHGGRRDWGEEDLLNVVAVETILQGGTPFALPRERMPEGAVVAAVFRY